MGAEGCWDGRDSAAGRLCDKRLGTGFRGDKESFGKCDRGGGFWVAGCLAGRAYHVGSNAPELG